MDLDNFDTGDGGMDDVPLITSPAKPLGSDGDRASARFPDEDGHTERFGDGESKPHKSVEAESDDNGIPVAYDIKPIEGFTIDQALMSEATPVFREMKLSNEHANKLMPLAGKLVDRTLSSLEANHAEAKRLWAKATKEDPTLGGAKWKETERLVGQAFDAAGVKKGGPLLKLLDESGLGNHPEIIRVFRILGARVGEARNARHRRLSHNGGFSRSTTRFPNN